MVTQEQLECLKQLGYLEPIQRTNLQGDASSRLYARLSDEKRSHILMEFSGAPQSLAEEKTPGDLSTIQELPFVNVQRYLRKNGVKVPEIHGSGLGWLLLEDFGDTTLYDWMHPSKEAPRSEKETVERYSQALDELLKIHHSTATSEFCIALTRRFDADLYYWEFEHFVEYGIQWLLEDKTVYKELKTYFKAISQQLAKLALCLSHRDYHAKNLMLLKGGGLGVLDFQDALLAPVHYDLASLLFDSYVDLSDAALETLIAYYFERSQHVGPDQSLDHFTHELRMMALQRNLKAAGRFVYIYGVKHKATHLPFVLPTLEKVKGHLTALGSNQDFASQIPFEKITQAMLALQKKLSF